MIPIIHKVFPSFHSDLNEWQSESQQRRSIEELVMGYASAVVLYRSVAGIILGELWQKRERVVLVGGNKVIAKVVMDGVVECDNTVPREFHLWDFLLSGVVGVGCTPGDDVFPRNGSSGI